MRISPLSSRVIQDVYDTGVNSFENVKKLNLCFVQTEKEFDEKSANIGIKTSNLVSAYMKLNKFITSDRFPVLEEKFTQEERMAWAMATKIYVKSMVCFKEMYREDESLLNHILEGVSEAVFIDNKINEKVDT